jgi:hypothetical protein
MSHIVTEHEKKSEFLPNKRVCFLIPLRGMHKFIPFDANQRVFLIKWPCTGCRPRRKQMKYLSVSFVFLLGLGALLTACGLLADENEAALKNVDAFKAMEIANEWKWSKEKIKSHVTTKEVVFEFANGRVKKIPLPKEKMLVAVAPYVNRTHR